ncbi:MAG: ABC-2 type transporter, partial [Ktedonobacterales bacterium]|nr:ABC-2 type transporter [Ktedonobacterales bacterium]
LGKLGAAVGYSWALALFTALVGMVVANLKGGSGRLEFYPSGIAVGILVSGFLISLLCAGVGVLISLRTATVRQAQQVLGIGFLVVLLVPSVVISSLPNETKLQLSQWLATANMLQIGASILVVLLVADLLLVALALVRFQRSRLILS